MLQEKCTRYWPAQGSEEYGSVQVTLLQQTALDTHNISVLQVQAAGQVARVVTHYRLTFWPLQGVPRDTKVVTNFLKYTHKIKIYFSIARFFFPLGWLGWLTVVVQQLCIARLA